MVVSTILSRHSLQQLQHNCYCTHCRARWCHTDLGANVYRWPKLIEQDQRLGQLAPYACGLPAENYDGVLMHRLIDIGWQLEHVQDKCLYDHSPSPQVWHPQSTLSCCWTMKLHSSQIAYALQQQLRSHVKSWVKLRQQTGQASAL